MAIPESQLETWSNRGSVTQSSGTYQTIRNALLDLKPSMQVNRSRSSSKARTGIIQTSMVKVTWIQSSGWI